MSRSSARARATQNVAIDVGDWLDVMDSEGVWNVARVINFPSNKEIEVTYDGWGPEFNEVVVLNSERVAPFQSYTWAVKCWAKYKKWPWWPSVVTFRTPGTEAGRDHLSHEKRMFVDFLDDQDFSKRCRCWVDLELIKPFDEEFDKYRKKTGDARYEASLQRLFRSRAAVDFATLVKGGTLPEPFKSKLADPVKTLKTVIGSSKWIDLFNSNQTNHSQIYVYGDASGTQSSRSSSVAEGKGDGGKKREKDGSQPQGQSAGVAKRSKQSKAPKSGPDAVSGAHPLSSNATANRGLTGTASAEAAEVEALEERARQMARRVLDKLDQQARPSTHLPNAIPDNTKVAKAPGDRERRQNSIRDAMAKTMHTSVRPKAVPATTHETAKVRATALTTGAAKARAPASKSLKKGDWLDVLDKEGTWNVAQILRMLSDREVEVKYDAWGPEYNEVVALDSGRVAPFHTYTWAVKCWAKYKNWPWWPSVVEFRSPGTAEGQQYLANETHMFVDFLDNKDMTKRCRRWIEVSQIKPYQPKADHLRKETNSPGFEASYTRLLLSHARPAFDPLVNGHALPVEFTARPAFPVNELKRLLGLDSWNKLLYSSRVRHGEVYAYQPPSVKEDLGFDDEDVDEDAFDDLDDVGGGLR